MSWEMPRYSTLQN